VKHKQLNKELDAAARLFYHLSFKEGMQKLTPIIDSIQALQSSEEFSDEQRQHLQQSLTLLVQFIESKDYILIADILKHELPRSLN
jgi:hypothetical protein